MISLSGYGVFITTFFFVSLTPGMCMTLALSLGISLGVRRTLWMMVGELLGVGLVALLSSIGVAAIMLQYPMLFDVLKYLGGAYLIYLGFRLWMSRGKMALQEGTESTAAVSAKELASQGFLTAVANPKGWAFFIALLPPFIDYTQPIPAQFAVLITTILCLEFLCLLIYASGGRALRHLMLDADNIRAVNRIAGVLLTGVGVWLMVG